MIDRAHAANPALSDPRELTIDYERDGVRHIPTDARETAGWRESECAIRCAACTSWMTEQSPAREWTRARGELANVYRVPCPASIGPAREGNWIGGVAAGS